MPQIKISINIYQLRTYKCFSCDFLYESIIKVDARQYESPHVKANLLLQCHMNRNTLPSSDYLLDTKTVMDNAARVLQAMIDMAAELGFLAVAIRLMRLMQE